MLAADTPSVTDWMQGWGNILSLVVSTGALVFTGWLLRHEIRVRREDQEDQAGAQARLVVGRIINLSRATKDDISEPDSGPFRGIGWSVENHSDSLIMDVSIRIFGDWLPDGLIDRVADVMRSEDVRGGFDLGSPIGIGEKDARADSKVEIKFTDAAGLIWTRIDREQPVRLFVGRAPHSRKVSLPIVAAVLGVAAVGLSVVALAVR
ncbi:hypothetical protein ACIBSW_06710 [Actinoplanes sp. NPDC049668]|uniref:hypothetical protein n=1 Tax=unclassified Actinoplanes TaxID=2626549 RepID=UPI0033BF2F1E